jgi:hypothetical protein
MLFLLAALILIVILQPILDSVVPTTLPWVIFQWVLFVGVFVGFVLMMSA